jgi:hypothetical protein
MQTLKLNIDQLLKINSNIGSEIDLEELNYVFTRGYIDSVYYVLANYLDDMPIYSFDIESTEYSLFMDFLKTNNLISDDD